MGASSATLDFVRDGDLCAGCGACAAVTHGKAVMETRDGFHRPRQSEAFTVAEEAALASVCPGLGLSREKGKDDHVLWGGVLEIWQGWATDDAIRRQGSSGGVLTALLEYVLSSGEVAFVVQTGADDQTPYANKAVATSDKNEVFDAAGSRYAPSSPLEDLETHLSRGEPFAFVGKPCDVAALRAMATQDPRIDQLIPYKLSFFCAGVPSLNGARDILSALGVDDEETVTSFRYRGDGWPGQAKATLANGEARAMSYHDSWGKILTQHLQFRCKICPDGVGGAADLVCADAWVCDDKGYPVFEERDGVSLVIARTPAGARLAKAASEAGKVALEAGDIDAVVAMQPGQVKRKRLAASRLAALAALSRPRPTFKGFKLTEAARQAGVFANIKSFLGTCRRAVRRA